MARNLVMALVLIFSASQILLRASQPSDPQGVPEAPSKLVLVGTVQSFSGDTVTLAALNSPRFTKTVAIGGAPVVSSRGKQLDKSAVTVGSVVVVEQILDRGAVAAQVSSNATASYVTRRVLITLQK
jgi:hypothetical protein